MVENLRDIGDNWYPHIKIILILLERFSKTSIKIDSLLYSNLSFIFKDISALFFRYLKWNF